MPSRWEVMLAGPRDTPAPWAARQAVVSGWLDDRRERSSSGSGPPARSAHSAAARAWACGPLRTCPAEAGGAVAVLEVRLLDDALARRLSRAVLPGRAVRLGEGEYQVAAPARETGRASWADLRRWTGERAWQVRFVTPVCLRRKDRTSPWPGAGIGGAWPGRALAPAGSGDRAAAPGPRAVTGVGKRHRGAQRGAHPASPGQARRPVAAERGGDLRVHRPHPLRLRSRHPGRGRRLRRAAGVRCLRRGRRHTTYGFGVACPEPTWQPPTLRPGRP